jgi:hypothetical protein
MLRPVTQRKIPRGDYHGTDEEPLVMTSGDYWSRNLRATFSRLAIHGLIAT